MTADGIRYAREVWAACATLGYDTEEVRQLKYGLDASAEDPEAGEIERLVAFARKVQQASVAWALEREK